MEDGGVSVENSWRLGGGGGEGGKGGGVPVLVGWENGGFGVWLDLNNEGFSTIILIIIFRRRRRRS